MTDEIWTDDLVQILDNFLSSNQQRVLIGYIDQGTDSLQLLHTVPPSSASTDHRNALCYLIRKADSPSRLTSIDEFLREVRFGCINGRSMACLTALVSSLFGPLLIDNVAVQDSERCS